MAITYIGKGTFQSGTADPTDPAWPTHVAGDLGIVFVETANEPISAPSGWTQIGSNQGTGTAAAANAVSIQAFYKVAASSSEAAPAIPDSGNHTTCQVHVWRGVRPSNILDGTPTGGTGTGTTVTLTGLTTTRVGSHIVAVVATDADAASTANFGTWANASLSSITERHDESVTAGQGGGFALASGDQSAAGAIGNTTVTGPNEEFAWLHFALAEGWIELTGSATVAAATTATGSLGILLDVLVGPTIWDSGSTTWDSGSSLFDGTAQIATVAAATTAAGALAVVMPHLDLAGSATIAAATTATGAEGYGRNVVASATATIAAATTSTSAGIAIGKAVLIAGSATIVAATSASGSRQITTYTIWDDGATTWDGGATFFDDAFSVAGSASIAAATSAAGAVQLIFAASGAAQVSAAIAVGGSLSVVMPVVNLTGSASIACATTASGGGIHSVSPAIPVWYEDRRADALYFGSRPVEQIYRGSQLLWTSVVGAISGSASIAAATTAAGSLAYLLPKTYAGAATIAAATTAAGSVGLPKHLSGSASIAAATTAAGGIYKDVQATIAGTAAIAADLDASGDVTLVDLPISLSGNATVSAAIAASGTLGLPLHLEGWATIQADSAAQGAVSLVDYPIQIAGAATIAAAVDAGGSFGLPVSIAASAGIQVATSATGTWSYVAPAVVTGVQPTVIAAATTASGTIGYVDLPIVISDVNATITAGLTATGTLGLPKHIDGTASIDAAIGATAAAVSYVLPMEFVGAAEIVADLFCSGGFGLPRQVPGQADVACSIVAKGHIRYKVSRLAYPGRDIISVRRRPPDSIIQ